MHCDIIAHPQQLSWQPASQPIIFITRANHLTPENEYPQKEAEEAEAR
jgi:hypothetical protein